MLNALITTNDLCASFSQHVFSLQLFMCLCKPLSVKQRNETEHINIKIDDQAIKTTDNIKLLGVNFDENLIFRPTYLRIMQKGQLKGGHSCQVKKLNYYRHQISTL